MIYEEIFKSLNEKTPPSFVFLKIIFKTIIHIYNNLIKVENEMREMMILFWTLLYI